MFEKSIEISNNEEYNVGDNSIAEKSEESKSIPEDTFTSKDDDADERNRHFTDNLTRKEFCRSVYFLLAIQVSAAAIIAQINFLFKSRYPDGLALLCLVALEGLSIVAVNISSRFCFECRLYFPMNFIVLLVYTFLEGCFLGSLAFQTQIKPVSFKYLYNYVSNIHI